MNVEKIAFEILSLDKKEKLKEGDVFKSLDKNGDFSNQLMFVGKPPRKGQGPQKDKLVYYIIFEDGGSDWYEFEELNVDLKSIRKRNDDDPDFYGLHG
jgi:hypothetical protein